MANQAGPSSSFSGRWAESISVRSFSAVLIGGILVLAGINHFRNPGFYYNLVPPWLGIPPESVVYWSGWAEIIIGFLAFPRITRRWSGWGIVLMLVAFIPAHIHFIQTDHCLGGRCFPAWTGWVRLVVVQPMLIYLVWWSFLSLKWKV